MTSAEPDNENRVLVLAPTAKDGEISGRLLAKANIFCVVCADSGGLCAELSRGAAALILAEEVIASPEMAPCIELLAQQPAWSDLPVIVLARHGADSPIAKFVLERMGNAILLERPVRIGTLISAVRTALRARGRQYQLRDYLAEQKRNAEALRDAEQALLEVNRRKDEFLATLAHELRNPLAPIRNAVEVLRQKYCREPEEHWCRDVIERQVQHLTRLIDDLLDISRITRNKLELRAEAAELQTVIDAAVEASRPLIDQYGHELTVSLPKQPIFLQADVVRLAQAFTNLLNNAVKYTEPGGRIALIAEQKNGEVIVRVRDNGLGICRDKLPQIFEMFFQVRGVEDHAGGGLGIGLALVRRLVEMHGGSVTADSAGEGRGSEFTVHLPVIASAPRSLSRRAKISTASPPAKRRVLVVDDNKDSADSLSMMLRALGHEVYTAYDGLEAMERAADLRPEAVLLDIGMPGMNGYEVAERLRGHPWGRELRLVALTGWGQAEDRERTRLAGFDTHLVKPVAIDSVVAALQ